MNVRFADIEIDVERYELRRGSALVPIEPQVFDLLVHLIRNRNHIVSKNELIDAIWKGRVVSEAALSSRVSAARNAIGDNGSDQLFIRTHYKRGFRFIGRMDDGVPLPDARSAISVNKVNTVRKTGPTPAILPPERPSIAVLPFHNMSGDPAQEHFADGLTEDIIIGLSRQRWFSVIARNSSFAFKGEAIDIRAMAGKLGVRYVLEGSVRKADGRLRITAQLVDAAKCVHLWADRQDSVLTDNFDVQDGITNRIVDSVRSQIVLAEAARIRRNPPENIEASDLVMRALPHLWRMSTDEQRLAQGLLQRAVALDADYAHAHALLGLTYVNLFNLDSRGPINELTDKALDTAAKALRLDDEDHWAHLVLGLSYARRRRPEEAVKHLSRSVDLNPNFALGHAGLGYAFACGGKPESGLPCLERARQLSPLDPFLSMYVPVARYMAFFALERYDETIAVCRCMASRYPGHAGARRLMTVSLGMLGRTDEAKQALEHTLTLQPDLSCDHVANATVYANASDRSRFLMGLQKAGLRN